MFKKNNLPIEDVLKNVAKKNKLEYVPPSQRITVSKSVAFYDSQKALDSLEHDITKVDTPVSIKVTDSKGKSYIVTNKDISKSDPDKQPLYSSENSPLVATIATTRPGRRPWNRPKKVYGVKSKDKKK